MPGAISIGGHGRSGMRRAGALDRKAPKMPKQPAPIEGERRRAELWAIAERISKRARTKDQP